MKDGVVIIPCDLGRYCKHFGDERSNVPHVPLVIGVNGEDIEENLVFFSSMSLGMYLDRLSPEIDTSRALSVMVDDLPVESPFDLEQIAEILRYPARPPKYAAWKALEDERERHDEARQLRAAL